MPATDTGVNKMAAPRLPASRRPNCVFSEEYGAVREILVGARQDAGLSQRALAARLGKTGSHVAMIERGQRRVDLLEFCRIAESLGLAPVALMQRIAERLEALRRAA